jgi:transposase
METLYVAADIAKQSFTSACWSGKQAEYWQSYVNDPTGYAAFAEQVQAAQAASGAKQVHLILEPTGGYELGLALFAYEQGWLVTKPNPKTLRAWAIGMGYRAKNDKIDALMLAEYGGRNEPAPQELVPQAVRELDYYLRRLDDLKRDQQAERNRLDNARQKPDTPRPLLENIERSLERLQEQMREIEAAITALLKRSPELRNQRRLLLSVPGIGPKNSLPILVLCCRFQALTGGKGSKKQLAAFLGLDSQTYVSGTSVHGSAAISKQGSPIGRACLYMGALGGIRGRNVLRLFYQQMLARGKAKKVALVACSRKILTWAWAVFCSASPFDATRFPHLDQLSTPLP